MAKAKFDFINKKYLQISLICNIIKDSKFKTEKDALYIKSQFLRRTFKMAKAKFEQYNQG